MCIRDRFNPGRQQIDENGYDQYGNQVDPALIPDRLDSANVEVTGLPPTLYMWRIKNPVSYTHLVQRVLSGKNEMEARRGTIFGAYLKLLPVFLFLIPRCV